MKKPCVLVAGPNISNDGILTEMLATESTLLRIPGNHEIVTILEEHHVDLLVLELSDTGPSDLSLIDRCKRIRPNLLIVVIDGDDVAGAFAHGATDAFPKPYDADLLAERVRALLRRTPDI